MFLYPKLPSLYEQSKIALHQKVSKMIDKDVKPAMRVVTRPDFDGVVCAALLHEAEPIIEPVKWVSPDDMQKKRVQIYPGDIIANLPYHENCHLWFDHHYSNRLDHPFEGAFKLAPSAAGLVYDYYKGRFRRDYRELVAQTDKIDSANLSLDEILYPENHPYIYLSMTVSDRDPSDAPYWNHLVALLRNQPIEQVLADPRVVQRCQRFLQKNDSYKTDLQANTRLHGHVSVTDFRTLGKIPEGNRFLVYSLFPDAAASITISFADETKEKVMVRVGHSILNQNCNVNVGKMLTQFGGGGHVGAGSSSFDVDRANEYIPQIIDELLKNEKKMD